MTKDIYIEYILKLYQNRKVISNSNNISQFLIYYFYY